MTLVGFHASHEQLDPRALLRAVRRAEEVGFEHAMCSDHFAPWSERQGESGFAWSWLGSALEATAMTFGVVTAPGQRYHPAIVAQAISTLQLMYPDRFWASLGSGEAMNEHITGDPWPPKDDRNARLEQSARVIRRLLAGHEVSTTGHVRVDRARVWSLAETPTPLFAAAVTPATARWAAHWADGLATVNQPRDQLRAVIDAYREATGNGPITVQVHVCFARTRQEALAIAHEQWRTNVFAPPLCWDLDTPEHFDEAARFVTPEDVARSVVVTTDPGQLVELVEQYGTMGADRVYLHHVGTAQDEFLDVVGEHVLRQVADTS